MFEFQNLEIATARLRVKRAKIALDRAEQLLSEDSGVGVNLALCSRIRAEQRRVTEARERMVKIDPASMDSTPYR